MHTLLSASLLSLGLIALSAPVASAQDTEPKKKAIRPRPSLPDTKRMKGINRPKSVAPLKKGSSRYKPLKPTIRPRGVTPGPVQRPDGTRTTPHPVRTPPEPTRHIRTPPRQDDSRPAGENQGPGGKGSASTIEKDEKCRPLPPRVRVKMNFNEAEVIEIVQWISKQTCKNFIIGDSIRGGKITILSNTPVTAKEAYRAFLSALNVNNMTVVAVGKFLKVQMKRDASKDTIPTYIGEEVDIPALDQMVTRVVQLKFVDANNINATVKQLTTKDGDSYPYAPTNTLIISDTGSNLHRLMEIINQLDTPLGQEEVRVIQVEYAIATELAQTLEEIFGEKSKTQPHGRSQSRRIKPVRPGKGATSAPAAAGEGGEEGISVSKIIPDERTNKIILVATSRSFPRIQELIAKLDVPIPGEGQIQVVYLQHADAEELASTLTSLAQGTTSRPKTTSPRRGGKTGSTAAKAAELFQGEVKVTADKATNSLVIVASQQDYKSLLKVIKKLDIPRRQVFVEAVIMEVNVDTSKETGIAFHGGASTKIGGETIPLFFGTQFKVQGSNINSLVPNISLLGFMSGLQGPELEADESILGSISLPSVGLVIHALQTDSNVNVLSTPHILTSDNEEAEIMVGENIPIPAGYGGGYGGTSSLLGMASQYLGTTGTTTTSSRYGGYGGYGGIGSLLGMGMGAINRQEVGLTLKIKPQINEGNAIRMELEEELSEVKDTSNPLGPTTTKRSAKTVVVVEDQQTVVVGGLMRDKIDIGESKIPILGDIPVLGIFFRTKKNQKTKTNLLLFLTPYVIDGPDDFRRIFERKMQERKDFMERFYGEGPEYEAFIDFRKRHGPLADIHLNLRQEMMKVENGGPGTGQEIVITPEGAAGEKKPEPPPTAEAPPPEEKPVVEEVPVEEPPVTPDPSGENRLEVE